MISSASSRMPSASVASDLISAVHLAAAARLHARAALERRAAIREMLRGLKVLRARRWSASSWAVLQVVRAPDGKLLTRAMAAAFNRAVSTHFHLLRAQQLHERCLEADARRAACTGARVARARLSCLGRTEAAKLVPSQDGLHAYLKVLASQKTQVCAQFLRRPTLRIWRMQPGRSWRIE